jgi:HEAT repeat protein
MSQEILKTIRKCAVNEDWKIREEAASRIKDLNDSHFEKYLPVWKQWISDDDPHIRRAVLVGLVRIDKKHVKKAFELIEPLLYDRDTYVRRNCGPFVLSRLCNKNPEIALARLKGWIMERDEAVRWNVASCLGGWFSVNHPEEAIKFLKILAYDERRFVWRAVASSLIKLLGRFPERRREVISWRGCEHVINTVEKYIKEDD